MIPDKFFYIRGQELSDETRKFLDEVLWATFRLLRSEGLSSKDCNFLGTNDICVIRTTDSAAFFFSRSSEDYLPRILEIASTDDVESKSGDENEEAPILAPRYVVDEPDIHEYLGQEYGFIDPVGIEVPLGYLSLQGDEQDEASRSVAELLIEPTREDVDRKNRIVRVNPIFQGREFLLDPDLVFVLMEFKNPYTDIYEGLIRPTIEEEGFRCMKSDDIFSTTSVIEDIWENINRATLVIAEISTNNPNVMYELGICHTIGKNVMMITQDANSIPFNFRHMRVFPYSNDIPGSNELKRNIRSILQHARTTDPTMRRSEVERE